MKFGAQLSDQGEHQNSKLQRPMMERSLLSGTKGSSVCEGKGEKDEAGDLEGARLCRT